MTKEIAPVGNLLDYSARRDAVHFAIAPVVADSRLKPGQHIGFVGENRVCNSAEKHIGIVDPFLKNPVKEGERFYMFLYPNTITGLRHEWTHPDFIGDSGHAIQSESERWLREFAEEVDADYNEMMYVAESHCRESGWGDYLCEGGKWEGQSTPDEFWVHFENVKGLKPKVSRYGDKDYFPGIFSCSC